ncbi:MAG: dephospho-CoA kinase [Fibrobacterales bacterium]|nr:dephospho-CoA kinase [Fibrobacterales bacterium]
MEIEISKPEGPALWAVTGNIGAGKSVVARMLAERRNAALVDADEEAHRVYAQNAALRRALAEEFGRVVLIGGEDSPDGTDVDREVLGRLVFGEENRSALARLDAIVRPVLLGRFLELFQNRGSRETVFEGALILEWGVEDWFDKIFFVSAPDETRAQRIVSRSGGALSLEEARKRVASQVPQEEKSARPGLVVVDNSGTPAELEKRLDAILAGFGDGPA